MINATSSRSIAALVVFTVLLLATFPAHAQVTPPTQVRITPPLRQVLLGGTAEVAVEVVDVQELYGFDASLTFDPSVVEVVNDDPNQTPVKVTLGPFLDPGFVVLNQVNNVSGTIRFAMTQLNPSLPKSGSGVLIIVKLRGKRVATSPITLTKVDLARKNGQVFTGTLVSGQAQVVLTAPGIDLKKTAAGYLDADQNGQVSLGDTLTYTFGITNVGNVALNPVTLSDAKLGLSNITCGASSLAPDGKTTCGRTYVVTQSDVDAGQADNTATATGKPPAGSDVTDTDSASIGVPQHPSLSLVKSAAPRTFARAGDVISYSYVLRNTGNATLNRPLTVDDDKTTVACPAAPASLALGASVTCTARYTATQADLDNGSVTNTATAHAQLGLTTVDSNTGSATATYLRRRLFLPLVAR